MDSAKKAFFEAVRIFAAGLKTKNKGPLGMNEKMVEALNGLKLE